MRSEETQITITLSYEVIEPGVDAFTKPGVSSPSTSAGTPCKLLTVSNLCGTGFPAPAESAGAGRQRLSSLAWRRACHQPWWLIRPTNVVRSSRGIQLSPAPALRAGGD
jgi:hypothetical protein